MSKVLIIEDEESIRRLMRYDLQSVGYEVDSASDGEAGLELALSNTYEVILIDWMLPKKDGLSIIRDLRSNKIKSILIMITAKDEEADILESFEAGADDYIIKPFSPRQLQARIKAHMRRLPSTTSTILKLGNLSIDRGLYEVFLDDELVSLTKKEYELFLYLIENKNHVLSREQILNEIWNFDYDGDTRIVDVHIFKLRNKLESSSFTIDSIRGIGYVLKICAD
ncbi:MAG: response regulator transcription factor [Erysipelothrix sp.]|nr:response regulator transcription factor [Erysipelothrix sp.]